MRKFNPVHEAKSSLTTGMIPVIFLVDDDHILGTAMKRFLESRQLSVAFFKDPQTFLSHMPRNPLGCVLLDIHMGETSGFDVARELKRRGCQLPIIFISGATDVNTVVRAMKSGAYHFFHKPADPEALYAIVMQAIETDQQNHKHRTYHRSLLEKAALLTPRELNVARLVAVGMLNKQIGAELGIAEKTVKVHRGRVMEKLQVTSVADLVRLMDAIDDEEAPHTENDS